MKTITLEIDDEKDYELISYLANKLGLRISRNSFITQEEKSKDQKIEEIIKFYQEKGKLFENFNFNREEANER